MANDGQIVFEVTADGKKAKASIRDITKDIENESKKWDKSAKESTDNIGNNFSSMLKKIGSAIVAAKIGQKLLQIGKDAIQAASDLQEVQNVVDTTFGEGAKEIEAWAKTAGAQFGLTETQAKRFASTMGAMMKSSGLAGDEIVGMSEDLAGLAADMASFYNLDFDTAFQKIRSGISGETEPLKQLGINMSVANLNAYALQKGLSKTFEQMTQGEQTMLRYQYMMEATADAQGDFARTSDGYANSVRTLETNLTNLKTNLGDVLLDVINPLVAGINSLFPQSKTKRKSILDEVAEIELQKDAKLAEINEIYNQANSLKEVLTEIASDTSSSATMENLAKGANKLDASSKENWSSLLTSLKGINGLQNLFGETASSDTITELASALAGESVTTTKAQAWEIFLDALSNNADAVSKLTGQSGEETKAWLNELKEGAKGIEDVDVDAWSQLMTTLVGGIDLSTDEGKEFMQNLIQSYLSLGSNSEAAVSGLAALGLATEDIEAEQAKWLSICKELVKAIPGLSSIIDTNTGEIKGGLPALQEYVDNWREAKEIATELDALRQTRKVYEEKTNPYTLGAQSTSTRAVAAFRLESSGIDDAEDTLNRIDTIIQRYIAAGYDLNAILDDFDRKTGGMDDSNSIPAGVYIEGMSKEDVKFIQWLNTLTGETEQAVLDYTEAVYAETDAEKSRGAVLEKLDAREQELADKTGKSVEEIRAMTSATEESAKAMTILDHAAEGEAEALKDVTDRVDAAISALTELNDYYDSVRKNVASAVDSVVSGFAKVGKAGDEYRGKSNKLAAEETELLNDYSDAFKDFTNSDGTINLGKMKEMWEELSPAQQDAYNSLVKIRNEQDQLNKTLDEYKPATMKANLEAQVTYMQEYLDNLETVRSYGVSNELLAMLSDGSEESAEYLSQLAAGGKDAAQEVDKAFAAVTAKKQEFTDALTNQQLTVDQVYENLAKKAKEAIDSLEMRSEAEQKTDDTLNGIVSAIKNKVPELSEAVDSIIAQLNRLSGWGINIDLAGFGTIDFAATPVVAEDSGRTGLDYIPHDDFIARLHEGERVLTAQENQIWNSLRNGGVAGFSLDELGGVMRDNVKPGGNVYLDGKVVGSVISAQQGKSYRQLQRSGWQG